ncbi:MAG: hypothetical protein GWN79_16500, partial [Actinobacteria bacterium]|nr:hypothetical protein [Actinomycetota bacterium]NIS33464.1 hypothetical protein [Actinomycetota bacterium]NIT96902.1 hypothetical protein [Actinomycetota bacterium]NIU20575.1 hypothetical protein [Actinomycetota bacterium]NIU68355.1 hypothetical protein [Actinomycetota bacterium]
MQIPLGDLRDRIEEALEGEYRSLSAELGLLTMTAMASMILVHRLDGRSSVTVGVPVHHRTGPDAS